MTRQYSKGVSSATLHIMAVIFLLCWHLGATIAQQSDVLICIGKLAYPIFAFIVTEGYFAAQDKWKYMQKLLVVAVISEIPFNLMYSSIIFYPYAQNGVWAMLIGVYLVHFNETARKSNEKWFSLVVAASSFVAAMVLGSQIISSFYGTAAVLVLAFYIFRGKKWWCYLGQAASLYYVDGILLQEIWRTADIFGRTVQINIQLLSLLALVPIWLYKGRYSGTSQHIKNFSMWFYPLHMLVIALIEIG